MEFRERISCHSDAVLCTVPCLANSLLASGGEDGRLCFTDARSLEPRGGLALGADVPALALNPIREHEIFAASGSTIYKLDLRKSLNEAAIIGKSTPGGEEINVLAVNPAGNRLAIGDDGEDALILDLELWDEAKPGNKGPGVRTLRRGHTNLVTAAAWRPGAATELVTGGADCRAVHWDVARLRQLASMPMSLPGADGAGSRQINPPFVSTLAFMPADRSIVAVARGDGQLSLHSLGRGTAPARRARGQAGTPAVHTGQVLPHAHAGAATTLTWLTEGIDATSADGASLGRRDPVLISGGVDGAVLLQAGPSLLHRVHHGPKINHLQLLPGPTVVVADVNRHMSFYVVR